MANGLASRKWQLTINNPLEKGYTHEKIKECFNQFKNIVYWCMCDEIGDNGTPHTHVYMLFANAVMFETMKNRFPEAHFENARGKNIDNRNYIRKEGKWADDKKRETNLIETFEESGEMPPDRQGSNTVSEDIIELIKEGKSDKEILEAFPSCMNRLDKVERARQTLLEDKYRDEFRLLNVTYIWGTTGTGKTRGIMEQFGYRNVYRVTNYANPFDGYKGEDVIVFEEFRSDIKISQMLNYLDGYPVPLPCRYADKTACYHKVYITTNIPLSEQYKNVQQEAPTTWEAFLRRINTVEEMSDRKDATIVIDCIEGFEEIYCDEKIF